MENESAQGPAMGGASGPKRDYLLPASILVAAILISGSIFYLVGSQKSTGGLANVPSNVPGGNQNQPAAAPQPNAADVMKLTDRDVILGDPKAPVTVIEYADYQCPFCARFFEGSEQTITDTYVKANQVKLVYRNFQFLGPESTVAVAAAYCAADQHQFWAYHDALYRAEAIDGHENNGNLNRALFLKLAGDLKLDTAAFTSCIDGKKYDAQVQKDTSDAQAFGVDSTPTIFINGQKILGAQPMDNPTNNPQITALKPIIEQFLKK